MGFDVTPPLKIGGFLMLLALFVAPELSFAQTMYATSGAGRGDLGSARLQAQLAVEKDRNDKAEDCANAGQLYGPNFAGNRSAGGCLTDLTINASGGITVSGNSIFNNNLTVTGNATMGGTLTVTGTISGAEPTASTHLATKAYVDTAAASGGGSGGGGGGGGVEYLGATNTLYTGNLGGWAGANAKCIDAFGGGAHMMTLGEYFSLGRSASFSSNGWINCAEHTTGAYTGSGFVPLLCGGVQVSTFNPSSGQTSALRSSCNQFTDATSTGIGAIIQTSGAISSETCNTSTRIHCAREKNYTPPANPNCSGTGTVLLTQAGFGTNSFQVPAGATKICVVGVAGGGAGGYDSAVWTGAAAGGGGGGACAPTEIPIPVTPGETLTWQVGFGGTGVNSGGVRNGGDTWIKRGSNYVFRLGGGQAGGTGPGGSYNSTPPGAGGLTYDGVGMPGGKGGGYATSTNTRFLAGLPGESTVCTGGGGSVGGASDSSPCLSGGVGGPGGNGGGNNGGYGGGHGGSGGPAGEATGGYGQQTSNECGAGVPGGGGAGGGIFGGWGGGGGGGYIQSYPGGYGGAGYLKVTYE